MSSPSSQSPSSHPFSARALEEAAELDTYLEREATTTPSPQSPHDSPGGAQGGAGGDRDSSGEVATPQPKLDTCNAGFTPVAFVVYVDFSLLS